MSKWGYFVGHVVTEWVEKDRCKKNFRSDSWDRVEKLRKPFTYVDKRKLFWHAPAGSIIDGASIPQIFWNIIDPYIGAYRYASVVHDVYCITKERTWQSTHRMFYEGMRCAGAGVIKAKLMYWAVYYFGPRWGCK